MPLNSPYSPTMVNDKSSLDIMSSIAENLSFIAKDLIEYVQIKTGKTITPTADLGGDSESVSPTSFVGGIIKTKLKKKAVGFLAKFIAKFTIKTVLKVLLRIAAVAVIIKVIWDAITGKFNDFFSNAYDKMKEGLAQVGDFFLDMFDKGGEMLSGLWNDVTTFMAPLTEKFTEFISGISDWFGEKFDAIKEFLGLSKAPAPTGTPDKATNNITVDKENVPAHLGGPQKEVSEEEFVPLSKQTKPNPEGAKRLREIRAETIRVRKAKIAAGVTDPKELYKREKRPRRTVTNERPAIGGEKASSTTPTPSSSSGGMDDTKAMIIQHEGIAQRLPNGEYEPYQDTRGLWTIGVGHLIGKGKTLPPEMDRNFSHEEVMNMFDDDFAHHKKIAEQTPGYGKANEAGKSAFVDLAFNMGKWWPKFPNAAKALGEGNFSLASNELQDSAWYGQVGVRGPKIVNLVAQAGSSQGTTLASNSNSNSIDKRSMSMGGGDSVVNSETVNNNTTVNNIVAAAKQKDSGQVVNRIS
jgi:GH24 family phage-related lysozyme (muramidase)